MHRYLCARRAAIRVWMVCLLSLAFGGTTFAATPHKLTIMVGGLAKLIYLPAKLTEQLGYFKEEGLDVELLSQPSGVDAENELLAGAVHGVVGFYDHSIDLQVKGKEVKAIVVFAHVPGEAELVATARADAIRTMADVRGATLGVTGLGSSTNFLTQFLASKHGIASSEYSVLPVGADSSFIAAMRQKRIDAGMTTEPTISALLGTGEAKVLVDLRSPETTRAALGGLYPGASLYANSAWVDANPEAVKKLARAFVKTLDFMRTHTAPQIAALMPKDFKGRNEAAYLNALAATLPIFTHDGRMPEEGPSTVLSVLSAFNPAVKGRHVDLSRTFTNEFVDAARK